MVRTRYQIEIEEGVKIDLFFTLSLFDVAKRRKIDLTLEDQDDSVQRYDFFLKIIYCAALSAWQYQSIDEPEKGAFPYGMLDFAEWANANMDEFASCITIGSEALAPKRDGAEEGSKKKD